MNSIAQPSGSPLIFLSRERGEMDGRSKILVESATHRNLLHDLAVEKAEDTVALNFDLGGVMPVLMADGSVPGVRFANLRNFMDASLWDGRVTVP